jgi:hypothetical protein
MARKSSNKIVAYKKTPKVTSIDTITESATLSDYEKAMDNLMSSSDLIIDRVLDKLENNSNTKEKKNVEEKSECKNCKNDEVINQNETTDEQNDSELNSIQNQQTVEEDITIVDDLKRELMEMKQINEKLICELESCKNGTNGNPLRIEINKLIEQNDNLILRNSELEYEISRLGAENLRLKNELEQIRNSKTLPPQTYSKESYTRIPISVKQNNVPIQMRQRNLNPRMSMNGYESWN